MKEGNSARACELCGEIQRRRFILAPGLGNSSHHGGKGAKAEPDPVCGRGSVKLRVCLTGSGSRDGELVCNSQGQSHVSTSACESACPKKCYISKRLCQPDTKCPDAQAWRAEFALKAQPLEISSSVRFPALRLDWNGTLSNMHKKRTERQLNG